MLCYYQMISSKFVKYTDYPEQQWYNDIEQRVFLLKYKVHNWLRKGEKPSKFEWSSTRSSKACSNSASSRSLESNASYQDKAFDGKTETGELMTQDPFIKKERCTQDPFIKKGEMQNISQRYWKWRRN